MADIFDLFKKISSEKQEAPLGNIEYIVVGLGNPEKVYEKTRHNAGFMAIDSIAACLGVKLDRAKFSSLVGEAVIADKRVLLMKPQTSMNLSGNAVIEAARFYKIEPQNIIVLSDDITLDDYLLLILLLLLLCSVDGYRLLLAKRNLLADILTFLACD